MVGSFRILNLRAVLLAIRSCRLCIPREHLWPSPSLLLGYGDDHRVVAARPLPAPPVRAPAPPSRAQPFSGGELVIHPGFVTLCSVRVISDKGTGQSLMILEQLRKTGPSGKRVALSAEELADNIGATDIQVITGCIKTLRRNIKERLRKHRRLVVGDQDVVAHSEQGYRLREWIAVREATAEDAEQPGDAK